ncbi:MAG TPA: sugar nucleotide-binding protein [Streptosporangiaceae bacterium]
MSSNHERSSNPVLLVGHGLIGNSLRNRLLAGGLPVASATRRDMPLPGCHTLDLATQTGLLALRDLLRGLRPRSVVLAHGPSDVTWIEGHETQAAHVHCEVARIVAASGVPAILVSTDNVFAGERGRYTVADEPEPCNAYGRVKERAERLILAGGNGLVLRISLIYAWTNSSQRRTFAERCLAAAFEDRPLLAPTDQVFTPVYVADVSSVIAAICASERVPAGIRHLSGPDQLSRYEFAKLAYRLAGSYDPLVRRCQRRDTEWASRPEFSSLACDDFTDISDLAHWRPMTPREGLLAMIGERPEPAEHHDV